MDNEILRYAEPNLMDESPHGTHCKVAKGKEFDLYVQINHDDSKPNWIFIGTFSNDTSDMAIKDEVDHVLGRI